jgi:hypothetical protein
MPTIKLIPRRSGSPYYLDMRDESHYKWIAAGFGWPADRAGALVVVGVNVLPQMLTMEYTYKVLVIEEEDNVTALVKRAVLLRDDYCVGEWYGDPKSPLMQFVHSANERLTMLSQPYFAIIEPHGFRDTRPFVFYASAVKNAYQRDLVDSGGYRDLISERLTELKEETALEKVKVSNYPVISALGYVIASLQAYKPWEYGERRIREHSLDLDDSRGFQPHTKGGWA